ncbi:MAG: T9SS type A sorting domain-containing protein [Salibacteraceae bacterium]
MSCKQSCEDPVLIPGDGPNRINRRITDEASTENGAAALSLKVYPNPAQNFVVLELEGVNSDQSGQIEMYDLNGKLVHRESMQGNVLHLQVANFEEGTYIVRYHSETQISKRIRIMVNKS